MNKLSNLSSSPQAAGCAAGSGGRRLTTPPNYFISLTEYFLARHGELGTY